MGPFSRFRICDFQLQLQKVLNVLCQVLQSVLCVFYLSSLLKNSSISLNYSSLVFSGVHSVNFSSSLYIYSVKGLGFIGYVLIPFSNLFLNASFISPVLFASKNSIRNYLAIFFSHGLSISSGLFLGLSALISLSSMSIMIPT